MDLKKASKKVYDMSKHLPQSYFDEEDDYDECVEMPKGGKFSSGGSKGSTSLPQKKQKTKAPLDMFFTSNLADVLKARKEWRDQGRQNTLNEMCRKDLRNKVCRDIARFLYDCGIPCQLLTLDSFHVICESIGQFGQGLKPPSMYEATVPLLKKEVGDAEKEMVEHKQEWAQKGCSILSDGWRLKPPSMYEPRVPLLKKEVGDTKKEMVEQKQEWAQKGCSILSDGWRDSTI